MSFHSPAGGGGQPLLQDSASAARQGGTVRTTVASSFSVSTGHSPSRRRASEEDVGSPTQTSGRSNAVSAQAGSKQRGPRLLQGMSLECPALTFLIRALIIDASGEETMLEPMWIPDLAKELHPECVDSLNQGLRFLQDRSKSDFLLQPSQHGVMVRSDCMRALVQPRRIVFLIAGELSPTLEAFLREFRQELRINIQRAQDEENRPRAFDLWAVECIVCAVVAIHTLRLQAIKPVINHVLERMRLHSQDSIMQLYPLKVTLLRFIEQVRPLVNNLGSLIDEHSHGHRWKRLSRASTPGTRTPLGSQVGSQVARSLSQLRIRSVASITSERNHEHEDPLPGLEEVLDYWHHNAAEVLAEATEVSSNIEDAMKFIEAALSYSRNELLKLELLAMAISVALAFGAVVSGIWGMNLHTDFMDMHGAFYWVVIFIVVVAIILLAVSIGLFKNTRNKYAIKAASFGNNQFFRAIGEDGYVLSLGNSSEDGALPEEALQKLLRDLKEPALPALASREMRNSFNPTSFRRTGTREGLSPGACLTPPSRAGGNLTPPARGGTGPRAGT
eukprot:TRINITY_DN10031_c0_g1_i1.p1 TRINITY_DN10031_c0_g1~~TRINITY_DN10031_c0_g1_i1.p1  ORF type:complete len:594 (+),score=77.43 TRINITY_DN10031_c0_g1_i1:103-1782(+)